MNIKPYLLLFVVGAFVGVALVYSFAPYSQPTVFNQIPVAERQSLAEALNIAAERLERGEERLLVDEYIRTSIASQPTSGHWASEINAVVRAAWADDAAVYAKNLRGIVQTMKAESATAWSDRINL